MKLFIDSADISEIKEILSYGILDGVTTNPSLIKNAIGKRKGNVGMESYIKDILRVCKGKPVSLEVVGDTYEKMVDEGITIYNKFNKVAKNVYVKIPVNPCMKDECSTSSDGIKAIRTLSKKGIPVNCTLIFTPEQAFLASKAGAKFVSPFTGREDDYLREVNRIKFDKKDYFPKEGFKKGKKILTDNGIISGVHLIRGCVDIIKKSKLDTEVLAASIRSVRQFREVSEVGADIATVPFSIIKKLLNHKKTIEGMKQFTKDVIPEYAKVLKSKK